jgi:hypothetical protein
MFLTRRLAASAALIAALAVPAASAAAATGSANDPGPGNPRCPDNYQGPTNLATGCPWYLMTDAPAGSSSGLTDASPYLTLFGAGTLPQGLLQLPMAMPR